MANPKIQEMVDLAALDVKRLREAASAPQARQAWTDFLEHANRAINRLEGYSRRTKQLAKYKALVSDEVWASPLTKYMRVARNAHEHGVEDLEMSAPHLDRIVHDNGFILGAPLIMAKGPNGEDVFMSPVGPTTLEGPPGARIVTVAPTIRMLPIMSPRGEQVMPPGLALIAEDEPETAAAARAYLSWVIEKIATFD